MPSKFVSPKTETDKVTWGAHRGLNFLERLTTKKSASQSHFRGVLQAGGDLGSSLAPPNLQ